MGWLTPQVKWLTPKVLLTDIVTQISGANTCATICLRSVEGSCEMEPPKPGFQWSDLFNKVIWDRLDKQRGMGYNPSTEGAAGPLMGGGGAPRFGTAPSQIVPPGTAPSGVRWFAPRTNEMIGDTTYSAKLPSGVKANFYVRKGNSGKTYSTVDFLDPKMPVESEGLFGGKSTRPPSTKNALQTFEDVFKALSEHVAKVKPRAVEWTSGSEGLDKIYLKIGPKMAEKLGGKFGTDDMGGFWITFGD